MTLKEIQDLIKFVAKSGVSEVQIEQDEIKLTIKSEKEFVARKEETVVIQQPQTIAPPIVPTAPVAVSASPSAPAESSAEDESKFITVKSPMIGTFYRSSSPDKPPFIAVGDVIKTGDVLCIVEAMKLFNEIESEVSGKIVKVLADDTTPIEYDQPLFLVDPS
jgi:acetyl-CoA carboxylase biotin carboxyl carrier protein